MSDWQPARLATREQIEQFHEVSERSMLYPVGALIRVRFDEGTSDYYSSLATPSNLCGGRLIEIHPDDVLKLRAESMDRDGRPDTLFTCEHRVVTD